MLPSILDRKILVWLCLGLFVAFGLMVTKNRVLEEKLKTEKLSHEITKTSLQSLRKVIDNNNRELLIQAERVRREKEASDRILAAIKEKDKSIQNLSQRLRESSKTAEGCEASAAVREVWK